MNIRQMSEVIDLLASFPQSLSFHSLKRNCKQYLQAAIKYWYLSSLVLAHECYFESFSWLWEQYNPRSFGKEYQSIDVSVVFILH